MQSSSSSLTAAPLIQQRDAPASRCCCDSSASPLARVSATLLCSAGIFVVTLLDVLPSEAATIMQVVAGTLAFAASADGFCGRRRLFHHVTRDSTVLFAPAPWDQVDSHRILLGRMPLSNRNEHNKLVQKEGVKAVLSVVEQWELDLKTCVTTPVSQDQWRNLNVEQLLMPIQDMTTLSVDNLHRAADFLRQKVNQEGKIVYVHCKAGRGRSACAIAAYLIKYQNHLPKDAWRTLRRSRCCLTVTSSQRYSLQLFAESLAHSDDDSSLAQTS